MDYKTQDRFAGSTLFAAVLLVVAATVLVFVMQNVSKNPTVSSLIFPSTQLAQVAAPTSGLVGYWMFDDGSGTTASDSSGSGHAGTISGATWTTGKISGALSFSGSDMVNTSADMIGSGAASICAWIYPTGLGNSNYSPAIVSNGSTYLYLFTQYQSSGANYALGFSSGGAYPSVGGVYQNQWNHVCVTRDASGIANFYINGALAGAANQNSGTPSAGSDNVAIGNRPDGVTGFAGSIDDVRIYNRALSASDVQSIYAYTGSSAPTTPPPAADTTAPSVPTGLAPSNVTQTSLTISWSASTDSSGIAKYNVYRNGSRVGSPTATSYADSGLTASTSYSYAVSAIDASSNANQSAQSSALPVTTASTPTTPPTDTTPPVISSVSASPVTQSGATISWTTNENSDSQVLYGLTTAYGSNTTLNTSLTTSHSQALSGLNANTVYHYQVKSKDAAGNLASSGDYTFTTSAASVTTYTISASISSGSGTITCGGSACPSSVNSGTGVTFTEAPSSGYTFSGWGGACSSSGTASTCTLTISANTSAKAAFSATVSDTTAPSVPTGLAVAGSPTASSISLSWTASTDNTGGTGVAGYKIYRGGTQIGTSNATSYTDSTVSQSSTYSYTVAAYDNASPANTSSQSTPALSVTTPVQSVSGGAFPSAYSNRVTDWSQAGVQGGIPNRTTVCSTIPAGASASTINSAISNCSNGVVQLSAGTYNLSSGITFNGISNVTLRGAGPDKTQLIFSGTASCLVSGASICVYGNSGVHYANVDSTYPGNIRNWTAGYGQNNTVLTISSASGMSVGQVIVLDQIDDTTDNQGYMTNTSSGFLLEGGPASRANRSQQQLVKITAINGNQITISPGLHLTNWRSSQSPQVWFWGTTAQMDGIENMSIENKSQPQGIIIFAEAYNGWVKNVRSINAYEAHVYMLDSGRIEIRDDYFYGTQSAASLSYGMEPYYLSDGLVINNIFQHVTGPFATGPSVGMVAAYNYETDMYYDASGDMLPGMNMLHDAGVGMNLSEGNVGNAFWMDDFHGTGGLVTAFRNQFTGYELNAQNTPKTNSKAVILYAYNRMVNVIGNILGTQNYHKVYQDSTPATGGVTGDPDHSVYILGFDAEGEQTGNSNMAYDPYTASTLLRGGNFDYATGKVIWQNNAPDTVNQGMYLSSQILPASLFLSSKPSWWNSSPWPAIGPDVTGGPTNLDPTGHVYLIPAEQCYQSLPADTTNYPSVSPTIKLFNGSTCYPGDFNGSGTVTNPVPTASLSASPTSITSGQSSTLTWSSTNASSCTGTGFSPSGTSGSQSVSPTSNTTYSLTCTGTGGTSPSSSATVTVGAVTAQTGSILVKIVGTTMDTPSAPSGVWSKIDSGSQTTTNPLTTASITTGSHTISVPGITGYTESYDTCTFTGTTECSMPTASAYSPMSCSGGTCSASVSVSANTTTKVAVLYTITVATNQPDTTPPSVPTSVAATAISSSQINLSWAASSDNTGVAGYKIYRAGTQIGTSVGNSYSDVGLSASTAYSYAVFAYDAAGNSSAASASASATTQAAPAPSANPTTHTITSSAGTGGTISPLGSTSVTSGGSQTFTIVPSSGYQVSSVIVDGASVGAVTSYPFSNVTATHSISANFTAMLPSAQNFVFTRVLRIGSYGEDVRQLQIFLNAHGFIIASSGNGSSGNETTYYGRATALAVSRFQVAHASEILAPYGLTRGTGYFGLATMKVVNALIAAGE